MNEAAKNTIGLACLVLAVVAVYAAVSVAMMGV